METITRILNDYQSAVATVRAIMAEIKPLMLVSGKRFVLTIKPATRSSQANARMWAMLTEVSQQVEWYGQKLTPTEWKHIFSAATNNQKVVPGIENGKFVVLGQETSKMSGSEISELMSLIEAFGAQHNVRFISPEYQE